MGLGALIGIVLVSFALGIAVQLFGARKSRYDFLIVAVTAVFGATFASNSFPGSSVFSTITNWGPSIDGFLIIPGVAFAAGITFFSYFGSRRSFVPPAMA